MHHFCTLFDSRYAAQGLALYASLERHCAEPFKLWILALDVETWGVLKKLELHYAELMPIESFVHDAGLSPIRTSRTHQEWCWTLASQWCAYLIRHGLLEVTYCDADTFFFADPEVAFEEIGHRSIAITPHRLIASKKHLEVNGLYNVGFVHFKSTPIGRECLETWAADCRTWCFNRNEPGRFGDQKYLDVWPAKYGLECCVIENVGVNAGPWSLGNWRVTAGPRLDDVTLIAYHAHEFDAAQHRLTRYALRAEDREFIYAPYLDAVHDAQQKIESVHVQA